MALQIIILEYLKKIVLRIMSQQYVHFYDSLVILWCMNCSKASGRLLILGGSIRLPNIGMLQTRWSLDVISATILRLEEPISFLRRTSEREGSCSFHFRFASIFLICTYDFDGGQLVFDFAIQKTRIICDAYSDGG